MMKSEFTLHCIPWRDRASILEEIRKSAFEQGLISHSESQCDKSDECCQHALVLGEGDIPLGCARISKYGTAECMVVLPNDNRTQIESALKLIARLSEKPSLQSIH
jgi:hypothetical protein